MNEPHDDDPKPAQDRLGPVVLSDPAAQITWEIKPGDPETERLPGWVNIRLGKAEQKGIALGLEEGKAHRFTRLNHVRASGNGRIFLELANDHSSPPQQPWKHYDWAAPYPPEFVTASLDLAIIVDNLDYEVR